MLCGLRAGQSLAEESFLGNARFLKAKKTGESSEASSIKARNSNWKRKRSESVWTFEFFKPIQNVRLCAEQCVYTVQFCKTTEKLKFRKPTAAQGLIHMHVNANDSNDLHRIQKAALCCSLFAISKHRFSLTKPMEWIVSTNNDSFKQIY